MTALNKLVVKRLKQLSETASMLLACTALLGFSSPGLAQVQDQQADDVVVNGKRYPSPRIYTDFLAGRVPIDPNGTPQFVNENSTSSSNIHACTKKNSKREVGKDRLSKDFEVDLLTKNDFNAREYGTVMIMDATNPDSPTFRYPTLTSGMTWGEATAAGLSVPQISIPFPTLGTFEYIVGIIHSHPPVGDPNPIDNRLPSGNDWAVYSNLKNRTPPVSLAPEYAFSHYIVGPDGKVREYRQDAGTPSRATGGINNGC